MLYLCVHTRTLRSFPLFTDYIPLSCRSVNSYKIVLGDHSRSTNDGNEQNFTARRIIVHPLYDRTTINHDIALIELSSPAVINKRVLPVCMPEQDYDVPMNVTCYTTGIVLLNFRLSMQI